VLLLVCHRTILDWQPKIETILPKNQTLSPIARAMIGAVGIPQPTTDDLSGPKKKFVKFTHCIRPISIVDGALTLQPEIGLVGVHRAGTGHRLVTVSISSPSSFNPYAAPFTIVEYISK
jgi:hypothetical protein